MNASLTLEQIHAIPLPTNHLPVDALDGIIALTRLKNVQTLPQLVAFLQNPSGEGETNYTDACKTDEDLQRELRASVLKDAETDPMSPEMVDRATTLCVDLLRQHRDILRHLVAEILARSESGDEQKNML